MSKVKTLSISIPGRVRRVGSGCPLCKGKLIAHRGATTYYLLCDQKPCPSAHMFPLSKEEEGRAKRAWRRALSA